MLLLEHHGKDLLRHRNIATPKGLVVTTEAQMREAIAALPSRLVLKVQIAGGGRGKAGGIEFIDSPSEAFVAFADLCQRTIGGLPSQAVLIEERINYLRERFLALNIEDGEIRLLFGRDGGVDIEDNTAKDPTNLASLTIDPIDGPNSGAVGMCLDQLGIEPVYHPAYRAIAQSMFDLAQSHDARLVEINPLVELADGELVALDARIDIDEAALDRHPEFQQMVPYTEKAGTTSPTFLGLKFKDNAKNGAVGLMGLGGGLTVTLMDWIVSSGGSVATLVDMDPAFASGLAHEGFAAAFDNFDQNPAIRAILVNIITCGYRLDDIVVGLVEALVSRRHTGKKPVVLHLRGNAMSGTHRMLQEIGYENSASMAEAIAAVVAEANR